MLEPAILHPKEMCGAVIVLNDNLKGCEELLRSRIRSGLTKEVIACIHMHVCVCVNETTLSECTVCVHAHCVVYLSHCSFSPNLKER